MDPETIEEICKVIITSFSVGGVVMMGPALLAWLGFGAGGVVAGSIAAKLMSWFGTPWLIAYLQSAGVIGFGWFANLNLSLMGGAVGSIISRVCNVTVKYQYEN